MALYKSSLQNPPKHVFSVDVLDPIRYQEHSSFVEISKEEADEIIASKEPEPQSKMFIQRDFLEIVTADEWDISKNTNSQNSIIYNKVVSTIINNICGEYKYDSVQSVLGWADTYPDALAIKTWATDCWNILIQVEDDIASSTITPPTLLELYNMIPEFIYTP